MLTRPPKIARDAPEMRRGAHEIRGGCICAPSSLHLTPVSSRTSRSAVTARSSPGSASPPGSFQLPAQGRSGFTALHSKHAAFPANPPGSKQSFRPFRVFHSSRTRAGIASVRVSRRPCGGFEAVSVWVGGCCVRRRGWGRRRVRRVGSAGVVLGGVEL